MKTPCVRLTKPTAALLLVLTLGVFTPASAGESRPTLKFTGSTPATGAIEDAFTMTLDNLIDINSITYDPDKWNDTGCWRRRQRAGSCARPHPTATTRGSTTAPTTHGAR